MAEYINQDTVECPECGARTVNGMTCWEQLGAIGAWEFQDPELLAEHFLTVASYNLQHPAQFTDEAIVGLRAAFIERLDNGVAVAELRRRTARAYAGKKRVLKEESERRPALRRWRLTIADVYIPDQPQGAAERVRRWAATIRSEL
jgi:hypothetical protein